MSDAALKNAEARRDAIAAQINAALQQIEEWRRELRIVEDFIRAWHSFAEMQSASAPGSPIRNYVLVAPTGTFAVDSKEASTSRSNTGTRRNSKKEEVAEAAREIIKMAGDAVSRADLYQKLIERGLTIEGSDPEMVLSTMLWRMRDRVARVKGGGYWLAEIPNEKVGYVPNRDTATVDHLLNTPLDEVREPNPADIDILDKIENEPVDGDWDDSTPSHPGSGRRDIL
jgi:hypothetical protein